MFKLFNPALKIYTCKHAYTNMNINTHKYTCTCTHIHTIYTYTHMHTQHIHTGVAIKLLLLYLNVRASGCSSDGLMSLFFLPASKVSIIIIVTVCVTYLLIKEGSM